MHLQLARVHHVGRPSAVATNKTNGVFGTTPLGPAVASRRTLQCDGRVSLAPSRCGAHGTARARALPPRRALGALRMRRSDWRARRTERRRRAARGQRSADGILTHHARRARGEKTPPPTRTRRYARACAPNGKNWNVPQSRRACTQACTAGGRRIGASGPCSGHATSRKRRRGTRRGSGIPEYGSRSR